MVVIDKVTKISHFIPIKSTYKMVDIADIFFREIFRLHRIPRVMISDRDLKFTSMMAYRGLT